MRDVIAGDSFIYMTEITDPQTLLKIDRYAQRQRTGRAMPPEDKKQVN
jgi:hypothetical protein